MDVQCKNCGTVNRVQNNSNQKYRCGHCGAFLSINKASGDTSQAVGLIGGAALGAAVAGPVGAIVGGVLGALLGKEGKGIG